MMFDQNWMADIFELQKKAQELSQGQKPAEEIQSLVMEVLAKWGMANLPWQGGWNAMNAFGAKNQPAAATPENWHIDIAETKNQVVVEANLPGIADSQDLTIKLQGDLLSISGKSGHLTNEDGSFHRNVRLPVKVTAQGAEASYEEDKLTIVFPKPAAAEGETIHLNVFRPK